MLSWLHWWHPVCKCLQICLLFFLHDFVFLCEKAIVTTGALEQAKTLTFECLVTHFSLYVCARIQPDSIYQSFDLIDKFNAQKRGRQW